MNRSIVGRRNFLLAAGASAAALGAPGARDDANPVPTASEHVFPDSKFPKLAMITRYSPQRLAFAAATGYDGVVIPLDDFFDPDKLSDSQIDQILTEARHAQVRILSIECMWGMNHIAPDAAERRNARARFIRRTIRA